MRTSVFWLCFAIGVFALNWAGYSNDTSGGWAALVIANVWTVHERRYRA